MKIWLLNNTKFGYHNNSEEWLNNMIDYFEQSFIPLIKKYAKPDDIILHLGNIFYNAELIKTSTLIKIKILFETISDVVPLYLMKHKNDKEIHYFFNYKNIKVISDNYTHNGINYITSDLISQLNDNNLTFTNTKIDIELLKNYDNKIFCGHYDKRLEEDNIVLVGTPYQLNNKSLEKGIFIVDSKTGKYKFMKNKFSPKYKELIITDIKQIEELDIEDISKNYIDIVIDRKLVDDKQIKLDVLLSKYDFKNVSYINENQEVEIIDNESLDIEDLVREKLKDKDNLMGEFENIMRIFREKY